MSYLISLAITGLMVWGLWRLLRWLFGLLFGGAWRRVKSGASATFDHLKYRFGKEQDWAVALAHPMAKNTITGGFDVGETAPFSDELKHHIRLAVMLQLGLPSHLNDAQVQRELHHHLGKRWLQLDIDALTEKDNWRDGMAFACMRVAYSVRCAHYLDWIDEATQWRFMLLNARRAQECFDSWLDYGCAAARGRQQWVAGLRTDNLGLAFTEADVSAWVAQVSHPWHNLSWTMPLTSNAAQS